MAVVHLNMHEVSISTTDPVFQFSNMEETCNKYYWPIVLLSENMQLKLQQQKLKEMSVVGLLKEHSTFVYVLYQSLNVIF